MQHKMNEQYESTYRYEGSWGAGPSSKALLNITATIDTDQQRGWFEIWDEETGGNRCYTEGGIEISKDNYIDGYDGVGSIDMRIVEWLDTIGFVSPDPEDYFRRELNKRGE
jgi:hypothetical protein